MYRYKPKEKKHVKLKRFLALLCIMALVAVMTILLHNMYLGIEINPIEKSNEVGYNLTRTLEEVKIESKEIADVIEETSQSVVGISKIKNTGSAVFLNESVSGLGLGTGMIVTDDRIYFNKSTCIWK